MEAIIRRATEDDAAAIGAIYGPYCDLTAVSFETVAPDVAVIAERIRTVSTNYPWLVYDNGETIAGYAYATRHRDRAAYRWSVDVAVYVARPQHRKGIARALYAELFERLVRQGYFKAYGGITLPNPGSVGLHEAMGFTLVGVYRGVGYKLGQWRDVAWYQKALQPERPDPPEPRGTRD